MTGIAGFVICAVAASIVFYSIVPAGFFTFWAEEQSI
jgi:hypothetical protein